MTDKRSDEEAHPLLQLPQGRKTEDHRRVPRWRVVRWNPIICTSFGNCIRRLQKQSSVRGGDFSDRLDRSARVSFGFLVFFSVLVLCAPNLLPCLFLGKSVLHATLRQETVGAAAEFNFGFMRDAVSTIGVATVVNLLIGACGPSAFSVLLPFATAILTFLIMSNPYHSSSKNLLVTLSFIVIQEEELHVSFSLGLIGICLVGVTVANFILRLPLCKSTTATCIFVEGTDNLREDLASLLAGVKCFVSGSMVDVRRLATSEIKVAVKRMECDSMALSKSARAAEVEAKWSFSCPNSETPDPHFGLAILVQKEILVHAREIRVGASQRLPGEEFTVQNSSRREGMNVLANHMCGVLDGLTRATLCAFHCCVDGDTKSTKTAYGGIRNVEYELRRSISAFRTSWKRGFFEAEEATKAGEDPASLAYLLRAATVFHGVDNLCQAILSYLEDDNGKGKITPSPVTVSQRIRMHCERPWPSFSWGNYRLPLKAAVGMWIASLWVALPDLRSSTRHAVWPALTVASVNQLTTGSSVKKCADRLLGTFVAATFALLIGYISERNGYVNDYVKIPSLSLFAFIVTYTRDPTRPYPYDYAVRSLGSILYGSIKYEYDVPGYVENRITMIVVGVLIFLLVELLLFPQSSREVVQSECLGIFNEAKSFFAAAEFHLKTTSDFIANSGVQAGKVDREQSQISSSGFDFPVVVADASGSTADTLREYSIRILDDLEGIKERITLHASNVSKALPCALLEPQSGFECPMDKASWTNFAREQEECAQRIVMLFDVLRSIQDSSLLHHSAICVPQEWIMLLTNMVKLPLHALSACCGKLDNAFPDGHIRPQEVEGSTNTDTAIEATVQFRSFLDVQLKILELWSRRESEVKHQLPWIRSSIEEDETLRMKMSSGYVAATLWEISHHLEEAGKCLEIIAQDFPRSTEHAE